MEKFIPIADDMKLWKSDFVHFDEVKQIPQGYPDYLNYKKEDAKIVQSWWTWTGKLKKSGEIIKIPMACLMSSIMMAT